MKILHTADNHLREKNLEDSLMALRHIVDTARTEHFDLHIVAGDLFDRNMMIDSEAYHSSIAVVRELANYAPVVMVRGNHDPERSLDIFPLFDTPYPVYLFTDIGLNKVNLFDGSEIEVVALPYKKKSDFGLPDGLNISQQNEYVSKEMERLLGDLPEPESRRILVGHLTISNSMLATKQNISSVEPVLSVDQLMQAKAEVCFMGHIHQHEQDFNDTHPIRYSGPHYRTSFAETQQLGFWVWEDGSWCRRNTPTKPVINVRMPEDAVRTYVETGVLPVDYLLNPDGAVEAKLKIDIPRSLVGQIDIDKLSTLTGAQIEQRVIPEQSARSVSVYEAETIEGKFVRWADDRGLPITDYMRSVLVEIDEYSRA